MSNKWLILSLIIVIYLPVSIDATVLHVAVPTLSVQLSASANDLLWIIDIYSLVMAGLLLPMGALGDRLGYKKLAVIGLAIFGFASLGAALAPNAIVLIITRAMLAIGAAMILPATLAGVRKTFSDDNERSMALGIWATVGVAGAAIGPLVGGYLLQYFYWGSVFLINIPIVIFAIMAILIIIPYQEQNTQQKWEIGKALLFIVGILLLIYAIKTMFRSSGEFVIPLILGVTGFIIIFSFIKNELNSSAPMIDFSLLKQKVLAMGTVMAMTAMISIVGFQLLMAQELQFVYDLTPLKAGLFMLPLMLASGFGGPIAGWLVVRFGLRLVATGGIVISSFSFFGLALCDFLTSPYIAWALMVLLGLSVGIALLASTTAIMSTAPVNKSASAGAIEGMAYELGAGFGIVLFGMMLTVIYSHNIVIPDGLLPAQIGLVESSISEAFSVAKHIDRPELSEQLIYAAKEAFVNAHEFVLVIAGTLLAILSYFVWQFLPNKVEAIKHN